LRLEYGLNRKEKELKRNLDRGTTKGGKEEEEEKRKRKKRKEKRKKGKRKNK